MDSESNVRNGQHVQHGQKTDELIYWVWLSVVAGCASPTPNTLLKYFGSPEAIYRAGRSELEGAPVDYGSRLELYLNKNLSFSERILEYCSKNGVGIVSLKDMFYPERLRAIPNRPVLMYYLGNFIDIDSSPCLAVVGTRALSERGKIITKRISYDAARAGCVIISGIALGADAYAHRAALYAGKKTIGILGCGIDTAYPPANRELIAEMCEKGLVMTEFAPGTPPNGTNFPIRNRIISALSSCVLVTEASQRSGALITAECALKQHKPLFAVPRDVLEKSCAGNNILLKAGAKPATCAADILDTLSEEFGDKLAYEKDAGADPSKGLLFGGMKRKSAGRDKIIPPRFEPPAKNAAESAAGNEYISAPEPAAEAEKSNDNDTDKTQERPSILELPQEERDFILALSYEPVSMDTLVTPERTTKRVLALATKLEISGYITRYPGNRISLKG